MSQTLAELHSRNLCRRGTIGRDSDGNFIIANDPAAGIIPADAESQLGASIWYLPSGDGEVIVVGMAKAVQLAPCPVEFANG